MTDTTASALADALRDRYMLAHELGRGGMATVWLARDLKHSRPVALKVMRPELGALLGAERFLREIRLTANLQHPHILPLLDSGDAAGQLYYVMPYVEGESLRDRLRREGQLPLGEALGLTREVAEALDYAHEQGIVHRDIKPENILLSRGHALVADFGVALAVSHADGRLTETGLSLGSPAYMSPEQATAEARLDGRSDQYSLACVVYEMLAGEPPYTGPSPLAIVSKRLTAPVPRVGTVREVPAAVDAAITRALARSPVDRFADAGAFASALGQTSPGRSPAIPWQRIAMAALLAAGLASAGLRFRGSRAAPATPGSLSLHRISFSGNASWASLSPDGRKVAFVLSQKSLVVKSLETGDTRVLVPPARWLVNPRWTRDGTALLFTMSRDSAVPAGTWMVPATGGAVRRVLGEHSAFDAGRDSSALIRFSRQGRRLEVVASATGRVERNVPLPDTVGEPDPWNGIAWSPDGDRVAISGSRLWLVDLRDSSVTSSEAHGVSPRWSPDGNSLLFLRGAYGEMELARIPVSRRGHILGAPVAMVSLPRWIDFDVGAGEQLIGTEQASVVARASAFTLDARGAVIESRPVTSGTAPVTEVAISADGESLLYTRNIGNTRQVEMVPFTGGPPQVLASGPGETWGPSWAPDGHHVALVRSDSGDGYITLLEPSGGAGERVGTRPAASRAAWAADGRSLAYRTATGALAIVNLERQTERLIALPESIGAPYLGFTLSPAGTRAILSVRRQTTWGELWMVDLPTASWRRMIEPFGESDPLRWGRDDAIYVLNNRQLNGQSGLWLREIWKLGPGEGAPNLLAQLPDGCVDAAIAESGRRGVCLQVQGELDLVLGRGLQITTR